MGNVRKRAARKNSSVVDQSETTSIDGVSECRSVQENEEETPLPLCPYLTSIVTVTVGSPAQQFKVHSAVLSQSAVLESQHKAFSIWDHLSLPDVDPSIFELALCYMYGKDYKDYFSPSNPIPKKVDARAAEFKRHSLLYCFARKYRLDGLAALATKNIKDLGQIEYKTVFLVAKQAYRQLPDEETWYRGCFKGETKKALVNNHDLFREPWVLDAFNEEKGNFTVDLFSAFCEGYDKVISCDVPTFERPAPAPKLSRWFSPNLSYAANKYSAKSFSSEWRAGDSASERESTADYVGYDETTSVVGSSYTGNLTPAGDSPYVDEACHEMEPTHVVEEAALAGASHPNEASAHDEGWRQALQDDIQISDPREIAEVHTIPASAMEAVACSLDAESEQSDAWGTWGIRRSFAKGKRGKKRRGRPTFEFEDIPAEPNPVEVSAEPEAECEHMAECEPVVECEHAAECAPVVECEHAAECAPVVECEHAAECESVVECEPVADCEPAAEPEPLSAAEEPRADLLPEPLWGLSSKKTRKKAKKARVALPFTSRDHPTEADIPAAEASPLRQRTSPSPPPIPNGVSGPAFRYSSLPVFKYLSYDDEPQSENAHCTRRGYHLAQESRWMSCQTCRGELSALARTMAATCNPGWVFTGAD